MGDRVDVAAVALMWNRKRGRISIPDLLNDEETGGMAEGVEGPSQVDEVMVRPNRSVYRSRRSMTVADKCGAVLTQIHVTTFNDQEGSSGDRQTEGGTRTDEARTSGEGELQAAKRKRWTGEEDRLLIELVNKYGPSRWNLIAENFPDRDGQHLRLRWMNHLRPSLDKSAWTNEEDEKILRLQVTPFPKKKDLLPDSSSNPQHSLTAHLLRSILFSFHTPPPPFFPSPCPASLPYVQSLRAYTATAG